MTKTVERDTAQVPGQGELAYGPATLELVAQGGWVTCLVTFPSEDVALATVERWAEEDEAAGWPYSQVWVQETPEHLVPRSWERLLAWLYPQCHHGLSADLCMDPVGDNHWGTREQELRGAL